MGHISDHIFSSVAHFVFIERHEKLALSLQLMQ